nr:hypothetical protein [Tanacetum cinerariifolium]
MSYLADYEEIDGGYVAFGGNPKGGKITGKGTIRTETVNHLKSQNEQLLKDLEKSKLMVLGYNTGLKSVEERLEYLKKTESIYLEDIKVLKVEIQMNDIAFRELRKKLKIAQKEKDGIQLNVDKFENASKSLNKLIDYQIINNCKKGLSYDNYNAVPPPYIGNFKPPKPDLSFTGLDEFVNKHVVENEANSSKEKPKVVKKNNDAPIIKEWVSDNEEEKVTQPRVIKKTVKPSVAKIKFVKAKHQEKTLGKLLNKLSILDKTPTNLEELDDSLVRAATTASSLEAEQKNGNIDKTQSKATPNESSSQKTDSGGCSTYQEAMGDTITQTRFKNVSKESNDLLLANEIKSLKRRVKKLKRKSKSRTHKFKRLYKVGLTARVESSTDEQSLGEDAFKQRRRIDDIDADEDITLKMFGRAFKRVNIFVDFKTELVEGSSKRVGKELTQESAKKQKVDDDKETTNLKQLMKVISDEEEVAIDAIPLDVNSLGIVD